MSEQDPKILTLADFTSQALIIPQLKSRDMAGAILELSRVFQSNDSRWDARQINQTALEREQQVSTAMDFGAAFPHVRLNICPRLQFALGRSAEAFRWGGFGSPRVRFVFLNAAPGDDAMGYLKLLSGLAKLGREPALLEQLKTATSARKLWELLGTIPLRK